MNNILIVATTSYAGMGPYVSEIVNEFLPEDNVFFLFRDYDDDFFFKNIKKGLRPKCTFVKIPNTHWNTLVDLICNKNRLSRYIIDICKKNQIGLVHFINGPVDIKTSKLLQKRGIKVVSTIHDLQAHEAKKEWYKMIKHRIVYKRLGEKVRRGNNFITNSKNQEQILKHTYPDKTIFYHPFPSLVTDIVKNGNDAPEELKGLKQPYILFFGRIEEYKGVSLLYKVFTSTPELNGKFTLVIAGKGTNTEVSNGNNVLFLNRYVKDTEVAYLFQNSKAVVYPYISATQSGVLTLALYFGTPILASDVPFFKETINGIDNGLLFRRGDENELRTALLELLNMDTSEMKQKEKEYYKHHYNKGVLRYELKKIYSDVKRKTI